MTNKRNIVISNEINEIILIIYLISVLYSKSLLTISMLTLFIISVFEIKISPFLHISFKKDIVKTIINYFSHKEYLALNLIFILTLLSGLNSSNLSEWYHHLVLKLPFLFLPFAFFSLGKLSEIQYNRLFYYFIGLMFLSSIPILINYIKNKVQFDQLIKLGQIIPTPIDHIKYSLLLSFSILASVILILNNFKIKYSFEKYILSIIAIFNFVILHILAVRSGIVIVYILFPIIIFKTVWKKNKKNSIFILVILFIIPYLSYLNIGSFRNKIDYMVYDYKMYENNDGENYSDSGRIYSMKVGIQIFKENLIVGTGIGDLKEECTKMYKSLFPNKKIKVKYPHNQFLYIMSGSGIFGLILFLIAILYPYIKINKENNLIVLSFMITISLSFLVENTIERSYSIGFYLFFILIALNYSRGIKE